METIGKIRQRRLETGTFEYQRKRQPRPRLGANIETLEAWLAAEEQLPARREQKIYRNVLEIVILPDSHPTLQFAADWMAERVGLLAAAGLSNPIVHGTWVLIPPCQGW